ncbi:MAG: hypothetical protein IPM15_01925 [Betaproteobacteria bacterium]|nr:hypothetical protein [Betaproteobacteria bacterium]
MKSRIAQIVLIPSFGLLAAQAFAQASAPAAPAVKPAATPAVQTAAATVKPVAVAATRITAAGNVLILADGIVANATTAQVMPPAPGFVYER